MTMIEILVVLALFGGLVIIGAMVLRKRAALREDGTQMTALVRAAQNMATMTRKHHRVVIDLDKQVYLVEECEGQVKLVRGRHEKRAEDIDPSDLPSLEDMTRGTQLPADVVQQIAGADPARIAAAISGKELPSNCKLSESMNDDADGRGNLRHLSVDDGVKIRRVLVQHLEDPVLDGVVTINFFPLGNAEKAVVEIVDADGDQLTLVVHALTGKVELRNGEIDVDEFMRRNAAGEDEVERGQDRRER